MNFYTDDNPIIACSTGTSSNTAIAVIRLSGFRNLESIQSFFSFDFKKIKPRHSHVTNIIFNETIFDQVVLVFFPENGSYTGENVLELSVHGNLLNINRILNLFLDHAHFRLSHPGEFTYRALKNKKLNLSQVEGLDMLLNANSSLMLSQGLDILQGDLHAQYMALYDSFLKLKAAIEISIDFSEDVGVEETKRLFSDSFTKFMNQVSSLKVRTEGNVSTLLSPEIALVGQTNAGKSSLFNAFLRHERSIVSNIAGTTRDYISEVVHIDGTNFKLVDTAGIRESNDVIENIGIERALEILKRSFFKILLVNPFETQAEYLSKFTNENFDFLILTHADVNGFDDEIQKINFKNLRVGFLAKAILRSGGIGSIGPVSLLDGPMGPLLKISEIGSIGPDSPEKCGPIGPQSITETGPIEPVLRDYVLNKFNKLSSGNPILLERHRGLIQKIYKDSVIFSNNINEIDDVAILSSEINILGHSLTDLIGIISPDDVLNSIFANFCIGK